MSDLPKGRRRRDLPRLFWRRKVIARIVKRWHRHWIPRRMYERMVEESGVANRRIDALTKDRS